MSTRRKLRSRRKCRSSSGHGSEFQVRGNYKVCIVLQSAAKLQFRGEFTKVRKTTKSSWSRSICGTIDSRPSIESRRDDAHGARRKLLRWWGEGSLMIRRSWRWCARKHDQLHKRSRLHRERSRRLRSRRRRPSSGLWRRSAPRLRGRSEPRR